MTARAPIPAWLGALILVSIATTFASNHVAARFAFEHGTSVAAAVMVRSFVTALSVLALLRLTGTSIRLPAATVRRAVVIGLLLTVQSYSLYSAVARLPVALALLTFNVFPIILAAISWAAGGPRPARRTLVAIPVILSGLVLALNVLGLGAGPDAAAGAGARWQAIGAGVAFALAASTSFALALLLTSRWLGDVDGRLRACLTMATVGIVVLVAGLVAGAAGWSTDATGQPGSPFHFPRDTAGWLGLALLSILYTTAFTSLFVALPRLGAVNSAPILNFEPIAAMVLGALVLGQTVTPIQIVGALLVIGGIVYLATAPRG